jgi:ATP-dependent Clp protease protease subunit
MEKTMRNDKRPRLLQLIQDNLGAPRAPIRVETSGEEATVYLYDVIDDWFGISAQAFAEQLAGITAKTIHLRINSPGGDVFAARSMVTAIRGHQSKVIAHIDGLAASAASFVALAAAEVEMTQGAMLMIHQAWTIAYGNSDDFLATRRSPREDRCLDRDDYERKTKQSRDQIQQWMAAETWFSADEAKAAGFVDSIFDGTPAENKWNLSAYEHAPAPKAAPAPDPELAKLRAHFERRFQLLDRCPA